MREIRFRAWRPYEKEMIYNEFHLCSDGSLYSFGPAPELIIMQFTGLHDKNGKEIWEGDIARWYDPHFGEENSEICSICFQGGSFCHGAVSLADIDISHITVIGNIHENPELLEAK